MNTRLNKHYPRRFESTLKARLKEPTPLIQTVLGPRQVGKTSGILNVLERNFSEKDYSYHTCEEQIHDPDWLIAVTQKALILKKKILVLDEIQKIENWSEIIKLIWDQPKRKNSKLKLVLLGSSSLQLSQGLSESLAGRFEMIPVHHWSLDESEKAFGINLSDFLTVGGYPGSYPLVKDQARFRKYMLDSIFESVVTKDILRHTLIKKPALFRQTFTLACQFPGQEVSYNKLLGQLQEAGNVDQVKHYLDLFNQAFLIRLIHKWTKSPLSRTSSPKLLPCAPVFTSLFHRRELTPEEKGRVFESMVGNRLCEHFEVVFYWREGTEEVDFIVDSGKDLFAVEVKTKKRTTSGIGAFRKLNRGAKSCFVDMENYWEFERDPIAFLQEFSI